MGTMAMDRETELARFMDSHKAQAQTQAQYGNMHDQNTSLQLNSDNIEEKRQRLRQERHQDWRMQQEKQKDQADMKLRQRQMIQTQNPPAVPPPGQVDYDGQADLSRQEQRKAYQDYQRRKEQEMMDKKLHPPPPEKFSGLQIGEYDNYLKENGPKMKMQYKDMLDQQQKDDMFRRVKDEGAVLNRPPQQNQYGNPPSQYLANKPPPAPGHRMREDGSRQTPRYWNEGKPTGSPKSIESEPRQRRPVENSDVPLMADEERRRMDRNMGERQQEQAPIKKDRFYGAEQYEEYKKSQQKDLGNEYRGYLKEQSKKVPNRSWKDDGGDGILIPEDVTKEIRKKELSHERQKDYVDFMSQQRVPNNKWPAQEGIGALLIKSGNYERVHQMYEDQRKKDFVESLRKKSEREKEPTPPPPQPPQPLPAQKEKGHPPYENFVYPTMASSEKPVVESMGRELEQQRHRLRDERKREYEHYQLQMKTKENPRRTNAPQANGPYDGIFHGLGDRGNVQEHLTEERKSDFKQHLAKENQNYGPPARPDWALGVGEERGTHRGSPARNYDQGYDRPPPRDENRGGAQGGPPPPAQGGYRTPNYNDMLNDKRKEEAHRRRHDDPEYQMRLTSMDSRDRDNDREKMKDFQQQQPQRGY